MRNSKEIVVGVATDEPKWVDILNLAPVKYVHLASFFLLTHEIGHALAGREEASANNVMKYCVNSIYNTNLNWPKEINFHTLVAMTIKERLV